MLGKTVAIVTEGVGENTNKVIAGGGGLGGLCEADRQDRNPSAYQSELTCAKEDLCQHQDG